MSTIRHERTDDAAAIRLVLERAFGRPEEANLVEALRCRGAVTLGLVALKDQQLVGYLLFSRVSIASYPPGQSALGLGPMAILPGWQRQGIGSQLIRSGLEQCRQSGHALVVVLGHPEFYRRFGFSAASAYGMRSEFDVPDEVFLVRELRPRALKGSGGIVTYQPEFRRV